MLKFIIQAARRKDDGLMVDARKRGRPRDPAVDVATLSIAIDILSQQGFSALTMESVAERAGVGKASLYRRWPNKTALVIAAVRQQIEPVHPLPDTGSIASDVRQYLEAAVRSHQSALPALSAVMAEVQTHPELYKALHRDVLVEGLRDLTELIERAVIRQQLPVSTDVELLASVGLAVFPLAHLITGKPPDADLIRRLVQQFFTPVNPTGGQS